MNVSLSLKQHDDWLATSETSTTSTPLSIQVFDVRNLLAGQLAESSLAMYKRDVAAYIAFAETQKLDPLNPLTLMAWRDNLALESDMSPNTINRMISAVKRIVKQAASKDMVSEMIALKFQGVDGVKVKALKNRLKQHGQLSPKQSRFQR